MPSMIKVTLKLHVHGVRSLNVAKLRLVKNYFTQSQYQKYEKDNGERCYHFDGYMLWIAFFSCAVKRFTGSHTF